MTIGEVAERSGLNTSAIRYYEKTGLLKPAARVSGRRIYGHDVLNQLALVSFAKELGFSLEEINVLVKDFPENARVSPKWRSLAHAKRDEIRELIVKATHVQKMLEAILRCQCTSLEQCAGALIPEAKQARLTSAHVNLQSSLPEQM